MSKCLIISQGLPPPESVVKSVGRICEITDECLTRGARNEIHICDSNMNGSSEREVISRHQSDNKNLAVCTAAVTVGRGFYPNNEILGEFSGIPPLSRIRNTRCSLVNDCDLSLGEVICATHENSKYCQALPDLLNYS